MAKTLGELLNVVYAELGKPRGATLFGLDTGTGSNTFTLTADQNITRLLNDAKDQVCLTALLIPVTGTKAVTAGDGPNFFLDTFTIANDQSLHSPLDVLWTPSGGSATVLTWLGPAAMRDNFPKRLTAAAGVPKYWSHVPDNMRGIELYRRPATVGTLTANGYGIASDLVDTDDTIDWLPDERCRVLIAYACAMLCRKVVGDEQLMARLPMFAAEYDAQRAALRSQVLPDLAAHYLDPLIPLSAQTEMQPAGQ